ncbi:MAG: CCA tRNA nucleotidyltransferase [Rhodobiaceae bacterium]|nr:CCA tRNA nucleotidyltransferase [Rhodobiaceae bacterium]MCC0061292.1 CCA tRNA nucleotidyltransferase [Rhodobiaceae bacterium]
MIFSTEDISGRFGARAAGRIAALLADEPGRTVMTAFNTLDVETRIVGGAVRNALAGRTETDVDCATTATPETVIKMAADAGLHAVPTGIDHGTVTIVVDGKPVEITTLRTDVETHGRHATVAFGTDWEADAARRDFTVNALYLDGRGDVHDPVGGAEDIETRRIRFIGSSEERIAEDYLRTLRFFRFLATFEAEPDAAALSAIVKSRQGIRRLSAERVRKELLVLLGAANPVPALQLMQSHGVLADSLAGVPNVPRLERFLRLEAKTRSEADPVLRLAVLAMHVSDDAGRLRDGLRLSNAESDRIEAAFDGWWRLTPEAGEAALKEAIYRLGSGTFTDRMKVAWTQTRQNEPEQGWLDAIALAGTWEAPKFPLSGKDLIAAGAEPGPDLGERLKTLETRWIESGFALSRAQLLAMR